MTTWFTADHHFGYERIITLARRPFENIAHMEEELIARWNRRVSRNDQVYVLGDFSYGLEHDPILIRLWGQKHLVLGNHDRAGVVGRATLWRSVEQFKLGLFDGVNAALFHYAMRVWPGAHSGTINLYGHSHGKLAGDSASQDVGVDVWDFQPVSMAEITARMAKSPPRFVPEPKAAE